MSAVDGTTGVGEVVEFNREFSLIDGKVSVNLNINPVENANGDDVRVGSFIGHKGGRIKTLSGKSKSRYMKEFPDDSLGGFRLQVSTDDTLTANWENVDGCSNHERFNEIVVEEITMCEGIINGTISMPPREPRENKNLQKNKKKPTNDRVYYTFWLPVNSRFFGKIIGVEGSVIAQLKDDLQQGIGLDRSPSIRVNDSGRKINEQFHLKVSSDEYSLEDTEGLWIVISYTGAKAFRVVSEMTQKFITNQFDVEDDDEHEDSDDDDDDGDDPEDTSSGW